MRFADLTRYADDLHRLALPTIPALEYSIIVPERMYVGRNPLSTTEVQRLIDEAGITHILDLREQWEFTAPKLGREALVSIDSNGIERLHIPVTDMGAPTHEDLDACIDYMQQAFVDPMARLYLHCRAGRERSGSVAVAWYACEFGLGYDEALTHLQKSRPSIWPLPGQERAVRNWLDRRRVKYASEEYELRYTSVGLFPPERANQLPNDKESIRCIGYMPVEPWIGRDGKVYPESFRSTQEAETTTVPKTKFTEPTNTETVVFHHSAVIVLIGKMLQDKDVYPAARYAWKVDHKRVKNYTLVMAVVKGIVVGVFDNVEWVPATQENFPGFDRMPTPRWGFTAQPASEEIARLYIGKRLPDRMLKPGAANPVKYAEPEME